MHSYYDLSEGSKDGPADESLETRSPEVVLQSINIMRPDMFSLGYIFRT